MSRFEFGKNWEEYSSLIDQGRVLKAEEHMKNRFNVSNFAEFFLDIGSGSGVFSAAALFRESVL